LQFAKQALQLKTPSI